MVTWETGLRGRFITFEGIDGVGKTTQLQQVRSWLRDSGWAKTLVVTREPGGTAIGRYLRDVLLQVGGVWATLDHRAELLLYAADRAQHLAEVVRPALADGQWVLCDRFTDSTIAYQGFGRELDMDLVKQSVALATQGLQPDLTLWFDVESEVALERRQVRSVASSKLKEGDRMEANGVAFQNRVRAGFQSLADEFPDRIVRIDAGVPLDALFENVKAALEPRLKQWVEEAG